MKKFSNGSIHKLPSAVLYLGDIERICELLKDSGCTSIALRTNDYELDSPEEFEQLASKAANQFTNQLEIKGYQPFVSIEFEPYSARILISDDSNALRGLQSKIVDLVQSRARPFWRTTNDILPMLPLPLAIIAFSGKRFEIAAALFLIFIAAMWWSLKRAMRQYSVIWFAAKAKSPGFIERNMDKIVLALLSGLFGAAAKAAVDWFMSAR
jgi:hypothetical protein